MLRAWTKLRDRKPARARGFTMIELLTVIFLIAFLMAFIAMVVVNYVKVAKVKACHAQLSELTMAMAQYYQDHRAYPPDSNYFETKVKNNPGVQTDMSVDGRGNPISITLYDSFSLWRYLGREITKYVQPTDPVTGIASGPLQIAGNYGPYVKFRDSQLKPAQDADGSTAFIVVDPWYNPIGYIGEPIRKMHARDSVALFSAGPNGTTASDDRGDPDHFYQAMNLQKFQFDCQAYVPGQDHSAANLGYGVLDGCLTSFKNPKNVDNTDASKNETLDDINNWDPIQ